MILLTYFEGDNFFALSACDKTAALKVFVCFVGVGVTCIYLVFSKEAFSLSDQSFRTVVLMQDTS